MRYLFGPTTAAFADEYLSGPRRAGACVGLGPDVPFDPDDGWDEIEQRLPAGWRPDRVVVRLADMTVPVGLWAAPVPLIGLAEDWDRHAHYYRHAAPLCDVVLAEPATVLALQAIGFDRARPADPGGLGRSAFDSDRDADTGRDIDVLVLDDLHPTHRRERLAWVGRVAQLADACRVIVRRPTTPSEDRGWLVRARVVVQLPPLVGGDRLGYEALAAGAALVRPVAPWDGPDGLRPGVDYFPYDGRTLEATVLRALDRDGERRAVVGAGQARVRDFAYATRLGRALSELDADWPELTDRATQRVVAAVPPALGWQVWAAVGGRQPVALPPADGPDDGPEVAVGRGVLAADPAEAAEHFRHALDLDPAQPVAAANLAEALALAGRTDEAVAVARSALARLDRSAARPFVAWDTPLYPPADRLAAAEWDRAAWSAPDLTAEAEAKRALLRWRLHALLARLTDDLSHHHEAALARPDLPTARAALGCALARRGRVAEGLSHLKAAVAADPLDRAAARALVAALDDAHDPPGRRLFARQLRRLSAAAPDALPAEPWFAEAGPVGDELASVVVVAHDQPELTRLCLESVLRCTRPPFELILVDNGCGAETAKLLEEFAARPGPARAAVVKTRANLGYPAAANRGLEAARGEYVVLLNNDAVATPGWLEGLVERLVAGWPQAGMVGPVSNGAPDPQRVEPGYDDLAGLDAFAVSQRRAHAGAALEVRRLSGFCLLVSRAAFQAVGPLDERFGAGFFDDDDWCVRARRAGYRLLVVLDTYVHHFGNATFRALGLDTRELLQANFETFQAKWGDAEAAPYRLPGEGELTATPRPTVSLCLIVKNEEHHLPDCLASARDLVDEVVVVDTGSTDRTKEIAAEFGAKVFDFPWVDSFAAARNETLRHATGDWVFWMDADDRLALDDRERLRTLFASLTAEPAAYVLKCRCVSADPGGPVTVVDHVRLFRHDPRLRWRYRVHEQILPAIREAGLAVRWSDVAITHVGYADPSARGHKLERDLRLLRLEEAEQPDDPFTLFNLGSVVIEQGRPEEALPYLERSLARSHSRDSIVRKLYAQVAQCHHKAGRADAALQACAAGREHYPDDAELLFVEGLVRQQGDDWEGAAACWQRLVDGRDGDHFASVDAGLRGYKTRHNLAVAYLRLGRPDDAEDQWRRAVEEEPAFAPTWAGLGSVGLAREDRALVEQAADRLDRLGDAGRREAADLRSQLAADANVSPILVD